MRVLGIVGKCLLALLLFVLTIEVSFRIAGALIPVDRGDAALSGRHSTVICVGDSHTWGLGFGYPRRLARYLGERSDQYRVVNLGVPGSNTAQHRARFEEYLDRYQPSLVVFWVGINNRWNHAASEHWGDAGVVAPSLGSRLFGELRLVKFLRVWREQSELQERFDSTGTYVKPELEYTEDEGPKHSRRFFGADDGEFKPARVSDDQRLSPEDHVRVTASDLRWMIERAQARGIPAIVVDYPLPDVGSVGATDGIRAAAKQTGIPLVRSGVAAQRVRERFQSKGKPLPDLFDKTVHPSQIVYNEVGDMILEIIDREGYLELPADAAPVGAAPAQPNESTRERTSSSTGRTSRSPS